MKRRAAVLTLGFIAAALPSVALAQRAGGGQGINYAPRPADYEVLLIDANSRVLRIKAADGRTGTVQVPDGVYDLGKLKMGDKIRIDFVAPKPGDAQLRAASVWPVK
jgi:hypothetical protein